MQNYQSHVFEKHREVKKYTGENCTATNAFAQLAAQLAILIQPAPQLALKLYAQVAAQLAAILCAAVCLTVLQKRTKQLAVQLVDQQG